MLTLTQLEVLKYLETELKAILVTLPASTEIKVTLSSARKSLGIVIEKVLEQ